MGQVRTFEWCPLTVSPNAFENSSNFCLSGTSGLVGNGSL